MTYVGGLSVLYVVVVERLSRLFEPRLEGNHEGKGDGRGSTYSLYKAMSLVKQPHYTNYQATEVK